MDYLNEYSKDMQEILVRAVYIFHSKYSTHMLDENTINFDYSIGGEYLKSVDELVELSIFAASVEKNKLIAESLPDVKAKDIMNSLDCEVDEKTLVFKNLNIKEINLLYITYMANLVDKNTNYLGEEISPVELTPEILIYNLASQDGSITTFYNQMINETNEYEIASHAKEFRNLYRVIVDYPPTAYNKEPNQDDGKLIYLKDWTREGN